MSVVNHYGSLLDCHASYSIAFAIDVNATRDGGTTQRMMCACEGGQHGIVAQRRSVGQSVVCRRVDAPGSFVFPLVVKQRNLLTPSYPALRVVLEDCRDQCIARGVTNLAMPRLCCGRDKLEWEHVFETVRSVFAETLIEIHVYVVV